MKPSTHPIVLFFLTFSLLFTFSLPGEEASEGEMLSARRILSFWKEGNGKVAIQLIHDHLEKYPETGYHDPLQLILGTAYLNSGEYQKALNHLKLVEEGKYLKQAYPKRLACYKHLKDCREFIQELKEKIDVTDLSGTNQEQSELILLYAQALVTEATNHPKDPDATLYTNQSRQIFERFLETPYRGNAKLGLAELAKFDGDIKLAIALMREAARDLPNQKAKILFQVVTLLKPIDINGTLQTLDEIIALKSPHTSTAALYKATLLIEKERLMELFVAEEELLAAATGPKKAKLQFLIGKARFDHDDYKKAEALLSPLCSEESSDLPLNLKKEALLIHLTTCYHLEKPDDVTALRKQIEADYPEDMAVANALFVEAMIQKKTGNNEGAHTILTRLKKEFPGYHALETVDLEIAINHLASNQPLKARQHLVEIFGDRVSSPHYKPALILTAQCSNILALSPLTEGEEAFQRALKDLNHLLNQEGLLSRNERTTARIDLAHLLYSYEKTDECRSLVDEIIVENPKHHEIYRAHSILALLYYNQQKDYDRFVTHGEKALELKTSFKGREDIEYALFHALIALSKESHDKALIDRACKHLYRLFSKTEYPLAEKELFSLASHYFNNVADPYTLVVHKPIIVDWEDDARRAIKIYQVLFVNNELIKNPSYSNAPIRLANLYLAFDAPKKAIEILQSLVGTEIETLEPRTKSQTQALYFLAEAYRELGDQEKALTLYVKAIESTRPLTSYLCKAAKLSIAELTLSDTTATSDKRTEALAHLKELINTRKLSDEPVHLQAAIEYAYHSELDTLDTLQKIKREFTSQSDIQSKDYHANRKLMGQKDEAYQSHIALIDAEINRLQAEIMAPDDHESEAFQKSEVAYTIYQNILNAPGGYVSPYLTTKAKEGIKRLEKTLSQQQKPTASKDLDDDNSPEIEGKAS